MDGRFFMQYLKDSPEARERLSYVFERMCAEGTLERTFYDGTVRTREEFLADVLRIGSLPFLVFWEGKPAGFTWYNTLEGRSARGHYVFFRSVWGRKTSALIGRCIYERFLTLRDVSIHSRPIRRLTPQPADRGRADCPSMNRGVTEKDFTGSADLSTPLFPLKGDVSNHKGIFDERSYLFDLIIGLTPKRNAVAWKLPLLCGAFIIGEVPYGAYMAEEGRSEDAVLVGVTRESLGLGDK